MGQEEVVTFLKTCEKPVTRKQIADGMKCDPIKVSHILRNLIRWNEVKFIEYDREEASKKVDYTLSRRTKFFYLNIEDD